MAEIEWTAAQFLAAVASGTTLNANTTYKLTENVVTDKLSLSDQSHGEGNVITIPETAVFDGQGYEIDRTSYTDISWENGVFTGTPIDGATFNLQGGTLKNLTIRYPSNVKFFTSITTERSLPDVYNYQSAFLKSPDIDSNGGECRGVMERVIVNGGMVGNMEGYVLGFKMISRTSDVDATVTTLTLNECFFDFYSYSDTTSSTGRETGMFFLDERLIDGITINLNKCVIRMLGPPDSLVDGPVPNDLDRLEIAGIFCWPRPRTTNNSDYPHTINITDSSITLMHPEYAFSGFLANGLFCYQKVQQLIQSTITITRTQITNPRARLGARKGGVLVGFRDGLSSGATYDVNITLEDVSIFVYQVDANDINTPIDFPTVSQEVIFFYSRDSSTEATFNGMTVTRVVAANKSFDFPNYATLPLLLNDAITLNISGEIINDPADFAGGEPSDPSWATNWKNIEGDTMPILKLFGEDEVFNGSTYDTEFDAINIMILQTGSTLLFEQELEELDESYTSEVINTIKAIELAEENQVVEDVLVPSSITNDDATIRSARHNAIGIVFANNDSIRSFLTAPSNIKLETLIEKDDTVSGETLDGEAITGTYSPGDTLSAFNRSYFFGGFGSDNTVANEGSNPGIELTNNNIGKTYGNAKVNKSIGYSTSTIIRNLKENTIGNYHNVTSSLSKNNIKAKSYAEYIAFLKARNRMNVA
jgi:hypothetical protein